MALFFKKNTPLRFVRIDTAPFFGWRDTLAEKHKRTRLSLVLISILPFFLSLQFLPQPKKYNPQHSSFLFIFKWSLLLWSLWPPLNLFLVRTILFFFFDATDMRERRGPALIYYYNIYNSWRWWHWKDHFCQAPFDWRV